jgi:ribosomal protein S8
MKVGKKQMAKWMQQEQARSNGRVANNLEQEGFVKDRKTGEWYNPKERFDAMMNEPEIQAVFKRLAVR